MNRNLLLVTYSFPPFGGVGVHRALSLVKYLPNLGWNVHVLTARNPSAVGSDPSLLKAVPKEVAVHRVPTLDLPFGVKKRLKSLVGGGAGGYAKAPAVTAPKAKSSGLRQAVKELLTPDPQVLWLPFAIPAASWIVSRYEIGTVLVTVPPYSSLRIATSVKKRHPKTSVITDFRDEWLTYYFHTLALNQSEKARAKSEMIERDVVQSSSCVVAVTEQARVEMRHRYPELPDSRFRLITNGYDPEAFRDFRAVPNDSGKVLFSYTGTVYAPADPTHFTAAVRSLAAEVKSSMQLRFIGYVENPAYREMLESCGDVIQLKGFLPQKDALAELQRTDFVLLIWNDRINIPGKLYDYLGTRKPIVAFAHPESEVWRIISETGAGWCADCRNPDDIAALLRRASEHRQQMLAEFRPNEIAIRAYERPRRAEEYSTLLESALREAR